MIQGSFRDFDNNLITVTFNCSSNLTIGEDGLFFTGDPLTISTTNDDTFNTIIRKSATINLATDTYLGDRLYAANARSIDVTITKNSEIIFWGFVDPNTFKQPYSRPLETFEINCIDYLSTLQYYNYNNATASNYHSKVTNMGQHSFYGLLYNILNTDDIYFDNSKQLSSTNTNNIFNVLGVSDKVWYGEDFDDVFTQEEVLQEILQYLNLHIIQEGKSFYIFDWQTIRNGKRAYWYYFKTSANTYLSIPQTTTLIGDLHSDSDTNISFDAVYNQIKVKDKITKQETLFISPLDKDEITSPFTGKSKYLTEYWTDGNSVNAYIDFFHLVKGEEIERNSDYQTNDYYIQYMQNPYWTFTDANGNNISNLLETDSKGVFINQYKLPKYIFEHKLTSSIFKIGKVAKKKNQTDNSILNNMEESNVMVISVNGNERNNDTYALPTSEEIYKRQPIAIYNGNIGGISLSPIDDDTTNYLVFSGKFYLQPIVYESGVKYCSTNNNFNSIKNTSLESANYLQTKLPKAPFYDKNTIPSPIESNVVYGDYKNGRYYTRQFFQYKYNTDKKGQSDSTSPYVGFQPIDTTEMEQAGGLEFKYCKYGDSNYGKVDHFKKLPILECELIIGNKYLVEYDITEDGDSTFGWFTKDNLPQVTIDGETVTLSTFSLGVNPAIGDNIIGKEYEIQNTIEATFNISGANGTAIPIKKTDNLSGEMQFKILGPVNSVWDEITKRHHSFWRRHKFYEGLRIVLAHIQNIFISDFECKIYSDNGGLSTNDNSDLVYSSAETNDYIKSKEDIEFKIITQLTSEEANSKGFSNTVNVNSVINDNTNLPINSIYNNLSKETAKPEEHYIDQYFTEYSKPKILLETSLHNSNEIKWNDLFKSDTLNKTFHILKMDYDVRKNNKTLTLKEI